MAETIYMEVTKDKYELPLAVAGSVSELARMLGITANAIFCSMSLAKSRGHRQRFVKVVIDEGVESDV